MDKWRAAARLVGVGWYVGLCILLGVLAGRWLDSKYDTRFWVVVGLIAGIVVAFYGVYRMLLSSLVNRRDKEKR